MAVPFWRLGRDRGADGGVDPNAPDARAAPPDSERSRPERPAEQQASLEVERAMRRVAAQDTPENRTAQRITFFIFKVRTIEQKLINAESALFKAGCSFIYIFIFI